MSTGEGLRKRRTTFFVQVPRDTIRDGRLSFRARGVLTYLLDMPDGWDVKSEVIAANGKEGREAIRSALGELAACGYYRLERRRLLDGRVVMGTAISEDRVGSWEAEYAEYGMKGVPMVQQQDRTFKVRRSDGTLVDDGFPAEDQGPDGGPDEPAKTPAVDGTDEAPQGGEPTGVTGDGFSGPGFPGAGSPGAGSPDAGAPGSGFSGPLEEKETGDREGRSEKGEREGEGTSSLRSSEDASATPPPAADPEPAQPKSKSKKGTRLPETWEPSARLLEWAITAAPLVDVKVETENFRDHWLSVSGQRGVMLDWDRTWQKWMRKEQTFQAERFQRRQAAASNRYDDEATWGVRPPASEPPKSTERPQYDIDELFGTSAQQSVDSATG